MIIIVLFIGISSNAQVVTNEYSAVKASIKRDWVFYQLSGSLTRTAKWVEETKELSAYLEIREESGIGHLYFFNDGFKEGSIIYKEILILPNDMKENVKSNLEYINKFKTDDKGYLFYYDGEIKIRVTHEVDKKNNLFIFEIYE